MLGIRADGEHARIPATSVGSVWAFGGSDVSCPTCWRNRLQMGRCTTCAPATVSSATPLGVPQHRPALTALATPPRGGVQMSGHVDWVGFGRGTRPTSLRTATLIE